MGKTIRRNHKNEAHRNEPYNKKVKYDNLRNIQSEDFDELHDDPVGEYDPPFYDED